MEKDTMERSEKTQHKFLESSFSLLSIHSELGIYSIIVAIIIKQNATDTAAAIGY